MVSSSVCTDQVKNDVFLSFRGKDTRNNFTSHFHAALCRGGINVFIDSKLHRGDEILSLMDIIQGSNISVIIFSKDYASSRWCLEELSKILECKNKYGQIVVPIFYHEDPSDVRDQAGIFGEAFTAHRKHFKVQMQRWRNALKETTNLSGWHLDGTK
ncbi:TMV resistance protein N-like [Pistacia vera]|uniref:TMV resistance protein N-like n=1 Tax=Pistacia vera TaxID=55513 RepID=UPI001263D3A5|nr:TMV resistance protein N-like [Pistacia vera]